MQSAGDSFRPTSSNVAPSAEWECNAWDVAGTLLIVEVFQFSHLYDPDADDFQNVISISLFTEYIFGEIFIKMRSVY